MTRSDPDQPLASDPSTSGIDRLIAVMAADSDGTGHLFRFEGGHVFRSDAGRRSDLMPAT